MSTTTRQTVVPLWHYQCPECGVGDGDFGHLAVTDAIYCEVCLDERKHVRLRRWLPPDGPGVESPGVEGPGIEGRGVTPPDRG